MEYSNEQIEEIINKTFPGLALLYRDTNLPESLVQKYQPGLIIQERAFTDVTYKGGGMNMNFRYLIASCQARNVETMEHGTKWGLCIISPDSYFKILDHSKIGDKTQVTLLHIPDDSVDFFSRVQTNLEEEIIQKARLNFKQKLTESTIKEVNTAEWYKRVEFPLGMDTDGNLFFEMD